MPISVSCPACGTRLNLADTLAGKTIRCSHCEAALTVPATRPVDDDDRPARRRPARDEEEDEDDRPRRDKKSAKKGGVPVWVFAAAGGGLLLVGGAVVAFFAFGKGGGGGLIGRSPPPGYSEVRDTEAGFRVYLPGQVKKAEPGNRKLPPGAEYSAFGGSDGNVHSFSRAIRPGQNFNPGTSPDQLYGLLKLHGGGIEAPWNEVVSRTPITLGGKPALEVKIREKKDWQGLPEIPEMTIPPGLDPEARRQWEQDREFARKVRDDLNKKKGPERPGRREVYYVTTDGQRAIILHLSTTGDFPSDEMLTTVRESFEFL